ncbi:MAG: rhodanese-like domain-containing protein [Bacteroidota bacterium]
MRSNFHLSLPTPVIEAYRNKELVIVDVRTSLEFIHGHIENACNLPFDELPLFIDEIKAWDKPIITCSAEGFRAERAADFLRSHLIDALDGGKWRDLNELIRSTEPNS